MLKPVTKESNQANPLEGREGLVYARVSSKRQEIEGSGLQSQESRCIADLRSISVPHIETFPDSYTGGGDFMKRPAMKRMLDYIDARPHKKFVVVFDDLSRFARDVEFHIKLRTAFRARDVELRCLNYQFDDSPEGQFAETIMAARGEYDRKHNRRQVIQKMRARLQAGYWPFGGKKGYKIIKDQAHGKIAVPSEPEATLLKTALEGFATGKFVRKLDACEYLVKHGFWKKQHPSKYIDRFASMLEDSFYPGYIEYLKPGWEVERCKGKHEGIISLDTFNLVQKRLGKNSFSNKIRADASEDFSLRGLLTCAHCGKHLTAAWHKKARYPYYYCQNGFCAHRREYVSREVIEKAFRELLEAQTMEVRLGDLVNKVFEKVWYQEVEIFQKGQIALQEKKGTLRVKIEQLADIAAEATTTATRKAYEKRIDSLTEELDEIAEPIIKKDLSVNYRTALEKATTMLENPVIAWDYLGFLEKQQLFFFVFQEKLPYDRKEGYRTENIQSTVRLFEGFATANPLDVEVARLNSRPIEEKETNLQGVVLLKGLNARTKSETKHSGVEL